MKRIVISIIAVCVIPIGVLQAVDCDWIADPVDTLGCECVALNCSPIGSLVISYDCPDPEGDCPQGLWCDYGSSGSDEALTYAEGDCVINVRECYNPEWDCYLEGLDTSSVVISRIGECYCK